MTREMRFRISGLLFYAVFLLNLSVTRDAQDFLGNLLCQGVTGQDLKIDSYQVMTAALVGLGSVFFTSDVFGYILGTVCYVFLANNPLAVLFCGGDVGYAAEMKKLGYNLRSIITERYKNSQEEDDNETLHKKFEKQWKTHSPDVFTSYIFHQAPELIVKWTSRRHTAFLTGIAAFWAIVLGFIPVILICIFKLLHWTWINTILLILSIFVLRILYLNAQQARAEAWQMIDLWIARVLNPKLGDILPKTNTTQQYRENTDIGATLMVWGMCLLLVASFIAMVVSFIRDLVKPRLLGR